MAMKQKGKGKLNRMGRVWCGSERFKTYVTDQVLTHKGNITFGNSNADGELRCTRCGQIHAEYKKAS